jgi:hypothetical protein
LKFPKDFGKTGAVKMGGFGSGRPTYRSKTGDMRSLDVNKMHRSGVFEEGRVGGWQWTLDGEKVASIGYTMEAHGIRLRYTSDSYWHGKEDINYVVPIIRRPCRYGGTRPYFRCPGIVRGRHCGRTVAKLYGGRYFLCRHCHNLAYYSQSETPQDRLLRKANKKRMALGGEPGTSSLLPMRPIGMWHRTYEREIEAILEAEEMADRQFMAWMMRRFGTSDVYSIL